MSRFGSKLTPLLAILLVAAGCKFNEITIPQTASGVVVHAVLNPSVLTQLVLVERTLTGAQPVADSFFSPGDPIRSDGGIPVSGASVAIIDSAGTESAGIEDRIPDGQGNSRGTGVYRISLTSPLRSGGVYHLRVQTPQGETVTGDTRVPQPITTSTGALTRAFNRDHDTLAIAWNATPLSRAYAVRIESPFGPYFLFSDSTRLRLVGDARNPFANNLEHLFIPGFRQDVLIAAVDSNFYDYYRTNNDPFTGAGIINRLSGGIGVFGSLFPLTSGTLSVIADQTDPVEGRFRASPPTNDPQRASSMTVYVESKSTRSDLPDVLSGRFTNAGNNAITNGIVGEMTGSRVTLVLVSNQLAQDTLDVFTGDLSSDGQTLTGAFRSKGSITFTYVKQ